MKGLSAGLTFFNLSTVCAVALGSVAGGLGTTSAALSLLVGLAGGLAAYLGTFDPGTSHETTPNDSKSPDLDSTVTSSSSGRPVRYSRVFFWIMVALFAIFAVRSFCWLLYIDGDALMIQSPNNLGDLALHLTYINDFANGTPLWPENPIYPIGFLRYPAGTDLFNSLLSLVHVDLIRGLVWVGLAGSAATCYALFRWGGVFGMAGFLFNGGIVGFLFLQTHTFADYQGDKTIAWKSLPLSMFVTQRGLLYAIPAGLILLWHWREKYFRNPRRPPLPFWVELSLYSTLPLFHVHTFLALSLVLGLLFLFADPPMRGQLLTMVAGAFVPATCLLWLVTDHFHAGSMVEWHPGWVMKDGDFGRPYFVQFWWDNFGVFVPLVLALFVLCGQRAWQKKVGRGEKITEQVAFLVPAAAIIIIALLVKLAPWEWDNLKVLVWAYLIILPFLWTELIRSWALPIRVSICLALFGSGFVSLFGGLAVGRPGFGFASRGELDALRMDIKEIPQDARFAAYPTYNHPLLLDGRNVVLGYAGHLWTQGFSNYSSINDRLTNLMLGRGDWRKEAATLGVHYIFWGREEKQNYEDKPSGPRSTKPWERILQPVVAGTWGAIYDLEQLPPGGSTP